MGAIMENLSGRKAEITNMNHHGDQVTIEALIPMRGLIGFETDLVNQTRGMGVMSHLFHEYGPDRGEIAARKNGSLVSMENGEAMAYALNMVQERGRLMVEPGDAIYAGMIVGENARENDIPVNPCKAKRLTNMRSQGDGKGIQLNPPLKLSLERALEYIDSDEYVEATPKNLRLRKKILDETQAQTRRKIPRDKNSGGVAIRVSFSGRFLGVFHANEADVVGEFVVYGEGADGFQQRVEQFSAGFGEQVFHIQHHPLLRIQFLVQPLNFVQAVGEQHQKVAGLRW